MANKSKWFPEEEPAATKQPLKSKWFPEEPENPISIEMSGGHPPESKLKQFGKEFGSNTLQSVLGAGDSVRDLLSLGLTKNHPSGSGDVYEGAKIAGNIGGFIGGGEAANAARQGLEHAPAIGHAMQWLGREGLPGLVRRFGGGAAFGSAENPENRAEGAKTGLEAAGLGELVGAAPRALGWLAEKTNPQKFTRRMQTEIHHGADRALHDMQQEYNSVTDRYGHDWVTPTPQQYLGLSPRNERYLTPNAERAVQDFEEEPSFGNLHHLQSKLGSEAAKISTVPAEARAFQEMTDMRQRALDRISGFLRQDPAALGRYEEGRRIGRERYYPYKSTPTLRKISEGVIDRTLNPSRLHSELTKATEKLSGANGRTAIPENHHLQGVLRRMGNRMETASIFKPGIHLASSIGGGVAGGATGSVVSHFLAPSLLKLSQSARLQRAGSHSDQLLRAALQQAMR